MQANTRLLVSNAAIFLPVSYNAIAANMYSEVRASQLAQASERVGSLIPASQQG